MALADRTVPDISHLNSCERLTEEDDISWCTGFWNELVRENPPSIYPESPIFSSKFYDWDDPLFPENVFVCPDVEEFLSGKHLNEQQVIFDSSFETKSDEDIFSADVYPTANSCNAVSAITKSSPSSSAPKQKKKRQRKEKADDAGHETPLKRKPTNTAKKTKAKK